MIAQTFPALPAFKKPGASDIITVTDMAGFAELARLSLDHAKDGHSHEWSLGVLAPEAADKVRDGDLSGVAASDAFLTKLEDISPVSRRWANVASVAGGAPNVGAFLAGSPMAMRRRVRLLNESAPLTILVDCTSSGGISSKKLVKRGAAVLALVRLLSGLRPVSLYAVCALTPSGKTGNKATAIAVRIDSTPLDLARAAFVIGHPAAARQSMYSICKRAVDAKGAVFLMWAHNDVDTYRENGAAFFARAIPGMDPAQTLFMPPVFLHDEAIDNPEKWLRDHLNKYGGQTLTEDA